jgi:hypothetical protein
MDDWLAAYADADGPNRRYRLLHEEAARLRRDAVDDVDFDDPNNDLTFTQSDEFWSALRDHADRTDGHLVVFAANDFGYPVALRPEGLPRERPDEVRRAILDGKYRADDTLDAARRALLDADRRVHNVLATRLDDSDSDGDGDRMTYHLPGGRRDDTNFLTVREAVGLVDYTTNSAQAEGLSRTY